MRLSFSCFTIGVSSSSISFKLGRLPITSSTPNFLKNFERCYGLFNARWNFAVLNSASKDKYG